MNPIFPILLILAGTAALSWPLGRYLAWAMNPPCGERPSSWRARTEALFSRIAGGGAQSWKHYLVAMLVFNAFMLVAGCAVLIAQEWLPLNPDAKGGLSWDLVLHTVVSFTTNTNLQHYSGEVQLSYFSQISGLMWLQFTSAATGLACLAALARGLGGSADSGNYFVDLQRAVTLVLLPLAMVLAVFYLAGGVPMTLEGAARATTLEGGSQTIARGPVAAFVAIKQLGTNGGGFFCANSTHPLENPTFFTNAVSMVSILLLPMACVWMFGRISRRLRHAVVVAAVMLVLLAVKTGWALYFESAPTPAFAGLPVETSAGNLEGKELRLGPTTGPLWAVLTTCTSNGSVGAMHDSLNPLTALAPLTGMWLNATFGGIGVGMINMFACIILAVFLAGMMIGRTPEYMGKRIEAREMMLAAACLLAHPLLILGGTALFAGIPAWGAATTGNPGAHGFTEILYEFSSAASNNGSGFEGLKDATVPWNVATALVMLVGRFLPILLPLAISGLLAAKRPVAETAGTLRTDIPTFGIMLLGVILLLGALTFLPAALLGPVVEQLSLPR